MRGSPRDLRPGNAGIQLAGRPGVTNRVQRSKTTLAMVHCAPGPKPTQSVMIMAKKKAAEPSGFIMFDVIYEDGARSSNRKIAVAELDQFEGDASARAIIEAQDRKIAEMSGQPRGPVKSIKRSAVR